MKIIDKDLLNEVSEQAKTSPRLRMNNDDGTVIESVVLCPEEGFYGVDIPKNVWHNVECVESGSVFFECKEGPFVPHEVEGVLRLQR